MRDNLMSEILGLCVPLGLCVSVDGQIYWFNDSADVLGLSKLNPSHIKDVFIDPDSLLIIKNTLGSLGKNHQELLPRPVVVNKQSCYVNVKNIGAKKGTKDYFVLEFTLSKTAQHEGIPQDLMDVMGAVSIESYIDHIGIPFSLFQVIRDERDEPVDLKILYANDSYIELSGKENDEIIGRKYSEVYALIDDDFVSLLGGISSEAGAAKFIDFEKGLKRYTEISAYSPVDDLVGCVYSDITDLVLANKSLQQEEEYIRTLVGVNPDIIFVFSEHGTFLDCHASDYSQLYMGRTDFIGKHVREVLNNDLAELTLRHIESVMLNKKMEEYTYDLKFPEGKRYFEARMVPHAIGRVVCIVRDISHKVEVEEELDIRRKEVLENNRFLMEVMEGVGYPLWVIDVGKSNKLVISDLNSQYEEVFGVVKEEMKNHELGELKKYYDKNYYENVISHYFDCLKVKKATTHERVLINSKTNKRMYLLVTLMPKLDEKGKVYRIIGSATDITGLKKTQDDLIMAKEKALEADKLKSTFLANMSHEIRTPLNSITGFSELIQDEDLSSEERQDMCRIIEKNSSQLLKLVNDIIEISKIESEQIKLIFRSFDVNHLMNELVQELELDMYRKKKVIPFTVHKDLSEGFLFSSDEFRIKQIFQHLLDNALKFTAEGQIEFGYRVNETQDEVEFFVTDSGIGIPGEKQNSIFELFRQLDESSTRKYGGTGLGLSICKRLVVALEGQMWVESVVNEGATFRFKLKRVQSAID